MKKQSHQWLELAVKRGLLVSLGLGVIWNFISLLVLDARWWWLALILPAIGLIGWPIARIAPRMLRPKLTHMTTYRLLYNTPPGWNDEKSRKALLNLIKTGVNLTLIWSRDGEQPGCWISVDKHTQVLERLIRNVFPEGAVEQDMCPDVGDGVVILSGLNSTTKSGDAPLSPAELCQIEGIDGVYVKWVSEKAAVVALWGPRAVIFAQEELATLDKDCLIGKGDELLTPLYLSDNPWPALPPFPASQEYAGLSSVSHLVRISPGLRITNGTASLVVGKDAEGARVGFAVPKLTGMNFLYIVGQSSSVVVANLAQQAIQAGMPVFFLDGLGSVATRLTRRLLREVATGRVLLCDVERPAQSKFRLNPLWLPDDTPATLVAVLREWSRLLYELGITAGGLGQETYRHTQIATILTALEARRRGVLFDMPSLRDALVLPDFLAKIEDSEIFEIASAVVGETTWDWWISEGRQTGSFDVQYRLGHFRDRLGSLLDIPEYSMLWRSPYLNPLEVAGQRKSLIWRMADSRGMLTRYISSQLLGLNTLLDTWPQARPPILIFLHELGNNIQHWVKCFSPHPCVRLIISTEEAISWARNGATIKPDSLLLSRLSKQSAEVLYAELNDDDIRLADLRRLPAHRLILKNRNALGTLEIEDHSL